MAKRTIITCDLCGSPDVAGRVEVFVDGALINVSVDLCARDLRDAAARYTNVEAGAFRVGEALDKRAAAAAKANAGNGQ